MPLIWRHRSSLPRPGGLLLLRASPLIRRARPRPARGGSGTGATTRAPSTFRCTHGRRR